MSFAGGGSGSRVARTPTHLKIEIWGTRFVEKVRHAATLEDIAEAMRKYGFDDSQWSARSLALHTQAVIQGAFVLAKAKGGPEIAAASLDHLRRYLELLFV